MGTKTLETFPSETSFDSEALSEYSADLKYGSLTLRRSLKSCFSSKKELMRRHTIAVLRERQLMVAQSKKFRYDVRILEFASHKKRFVMVE